MPPTNQEQAREAREPGWYWCAWIGSNKRRHEDLAYFDEDGWRESVDSDWDEILNPDEVLCRVPSAATIDAMTEVLRKVREAGHAKGCHWLGLVCTCHLRDVERVLKAFELATSEGTGAASGRSPEVPA